MWAAGKLAVVAMQAALLVLALCASAAVASQSQQGKVLVVGDSLEEMTTPYLARHLPGVPLTVNAVGGYNSYQILGLFEESYDPSHSVIVFDAGTNDNPAYPEILAGNLRAVAGTIGDRCMVVPTIHGLVVDGVDSTGKNEVVASFAASRPGTQVPDWAGAVATQPELLQSDNLHPTPAGADYRAQLIAQGVLECLALESAPPVSAAPPKPDLAPARRLSAKGASLIRSVAEGTVRHLVAQVTQRQPTLAAALVLAATIGRDA